MTAAERTNVLLEDMQTKNQAMFEGLMGALEGLERKMDARFDRLEERVTILENAVRLLFEEVAELRAEVNQLRSDTNHLRADVNELRSDFDKRTELSRLDGWSVAWRCSKNGGIPETCRPFVRRVVRGLASADFAKRPQRRALFGKVGRRRAEKLHEQPVR